jgi:hypothetical protein
LGLGNQADIELRINKLMSELRTLTLAKYPNEGVTAVTGLNSIECFWCEGGAMSDQFIDPIPIEDAEALITPCIARGKLRRIPTISSLPGPC